MTDPSAFASKAKEWVNTGELPGLQYLIAEGGSVIASECLGHQDLEQRQPVNSNTLYRLASATKIFVSIGFLRLVQNGVLKLDDPVSEVLPEYKNLTVLNADGAPQAAQQTMRMVDLLRHTCGYGYGNQGAFRDALLGAGLLGVDDLGYDHWLTTLNLRDWAAALAQLPMEEEPGTRVSYGLGHDLAGAVIEAATGTQLDDFMIQEVFTPLGLENTFFVVPEIRQADLSAFYTQQDGKAVSVETAKQSEFLHRPLAFSGGGGWDMLGNGGLVSNTQDFTTLLEMIVNNGVHDGHEFLSSQHAALLSHSQSSMLPYKDMLPGCEYSYGVAEVIDPERYQSKGTGSSGPKGKMWWGGSTNTYFFYVPEKKRVGVMLTNTFPFGHRGAVFKFGQLSA